MASKLSRTESRAIPAKAAAKACEEVATTLEHPHKTPSPPSHQQESEEEKNPPTSSPKDPNGHKVKTQIEIETSLHRTKFLPLSDTILNWDVWFQPIEVVSYFKGVLDVKVEELFVGGDAMHTNVTNVQIAADDLLRMIYLADMYANDYYSLERVAYDNWFVDLVTAQLKEKKITDMNDHAVIAQYALSDAKFKIGSGTRLEAYFQKKCVHVFKDTINTFENPNSIVCRTGRSRFEYVVESRLFSVDDKLHPERLVDMLDVGEK